MLLTSSLSPLGRESRQAPVIVDRARSRFPLQPSSAKERNPSPNHKESSPGSWPVPRQSWSPSLAAHYS